MLRYLHIPPSLDKRTSMFLFRPFENVIWRAFCNILMHTSLYSLFVNGLAILATWCLGHKGEGGVIKVTTYKYISVFDFLK